MVSNAYISTKEAAKIAGHSADYIARLLRSGDIRGVREGKAWRVDHSSLAAYLERKQRRGVRRAMELSHERREEYQISVGIPRFFTPPTATAALREPVPALSRATALAAAAIVVFSSALLAQSPLLARAVSALEPASHSLALGAEAAKERAASYIESRMASVRKASLASRSRILAAPEAYVPAPETEHALLALAALTGASAGMPTPRSIASVDIPSSARTFIGAVRATQQMVRNPASIPYTLQETSRAIARNVGAYGLTVGALLRDGLARVPGTLLAIHTELGRTIVTATHAAIAADVKFSYAAAAATASSAETFVATTADITSFYAVFLANAGLLVREAPGYARGAGIEAIAAFSSVYLAAAGAGIERSVDEMR